ncbi:hypothetical protein TNCV_1274811 [Trichonephila clavipes]|nr:hypothetical protein TNCV_1274811 [Trichonephila clavipes]
MKPAENIRELINLKPTYALNFFSAESRDIAGHVINTRAQSRESSGCGMLCKGAPSDALLLDYQRELEVSGDSFQPEPPTSSSVSTTKRERHQSFWIKNKSTHYIKWGKHTDSTASNLLKLLEAALKDKTPSELCKQFYPSEVCDLILKEIMRYAADVKNEHESPLLTKYVFL